MMKRTVALLLVLTLACSLLGAAFALGAASPSVTVYVNGKWVCAQTLGGAGTRWVSFPIPKSTLKNGTVNYIRITDNIANGDAADTQVSICMTAAGASDTYRTSHQWLDDSYSAESGFNADFNLEGWDGTQWVCVHSTGAYGADSSALLGKKPDGTYQGFARNINLADDVTEKYSNFRIRAQLIIGSSLTVNSDVDALFPAENYCSCSFCDTCGGCTNPSCTMGHVPCGLTPGGHHCTMCSVCGGCTCEDPECDCTHTHCTCGQTSSYRPAIRARFNGKWYGLYLDEGALDGEWVSIPVEMGSLTAGSIAYTAVSSNVINTDTSALKIWATSESSNPESFESNDRYCDNNWSQCSNKNINIRVEGWNGTQWVDLNANAPTYEKDTANDLGYGADGVWSVACRNITLGSTEDIKYVRVSLQLSSDADIAAVADYVPDEFATFLDPKLASENPEGTDDIDHKTEPDTPSSEGTASGSKTGAALQVRVNGGAWYETALDSVTTDSNGIGWAAVSIPVSILRSNGENQFMLTTNVTNGAAYSINSVDLFATKVDAGASFKNVNEYFDDWTAYSGYEWNVLLQVSAGDGTWITVSDHPDTYYDDTTALGTTADGKASYAARNIVTEDLSSYTEARILVQLHIGSYLQASGVSYEHKLTPDEPHRGTLGGTRDGARLQVRVNGINWYETALDDIRAGENDVALVPIEIPAEALRANGENQFLLTSNVKNGEEYSDNSIDIYATVGGNNSFKNVNDYYDDWTYYENYGWNAQLQASSDGTTWTVLSGNPELYYDASYPLGKLASGRGSYAARNVVVGDLSGYSMFRLLVQVHLGKSLTSDSSQNVVVDHVTTAPAEGPSEHGGSSSGALLYVRVNGTWTWISLQDYAGTTGWVYCPIDFSLLNANTENYFNVATNVLSFGTDTASSVDIFSTDAKDAAAYYTYDPYCDNGWATLPNQYMDIRLELFNGKEWVVVPSGMEYYFDNAYNLGQNSSGQAMAAARNLVVGDLSGYTKARIAVMMHVGTSLSYYDSPIDGIWVYHPDTITEEAPGTNVADSEDIVLRIRVNGNWFEESLQPYKGQDGVWVPVTIDGTSLNAGVENYFSVATNAASYGAHSGSSVDLYYSNAAEDLNSFWTDDEYCDTGYERYDDRVINLRLEGFNGTDWVTVAPTARSYSDGCGLLGFNAETEEFTNYARNIVLGGLDSYSQFRVCVQLHVGKTLALLDDFGGTAESFDRNRDVGRPAPAEAPELNEPDAPAEKDSEGFPWWTLGAGGAGLCAAGGILWFLLGRKKKKNEE